MSSFIFIFEKSLILKLCFTSFKIESNSFSFNEILREVFSVFRVRYSKLFCNVEVNFLNYDILFSCSLSNLPNTLTIVLLI